MADNMFLGAQHISNALASYEAARSGFFNFIIPGDRINQMLRASISMDNFETATDDDRLSPKADEHFSLNVIKAPVPHFSVEVLRYKRGNEEVKFAGVPSFKGGSITVDDVVGLRTKDILMAWQAKTYDVRTGKGGRMRDYKIDCTLVEYTQDYIPIRTWTLFGCFPYEISEDDFNKESWIR